MKITILAIGSEGDVRPMLALGKGLQAIGLDVCIATHGVFERSVHDLRLRFAPIRANTREGLEGEVAQAAMQKGKYGDLIRMLRPFILEMANDSWAASQGADVLIYSTVGWFAGPHICEKLNVPGIPVFYQPFDPTRSFPALVIQRDLGGIFNRLTYFFADAMNWLPFRPAINEWRQEQLNLPPRGLNWQNEFRRQRNLTLYAFSPHVVPKPQDWSDHIFITGYWLPDDMADWQPPWGLVDFLTTGPPPVYIGFGSMSSRKPEATANIVLQALARSKQRGVLATGWGGLSQSDLPDDVFKIEWAPHTWLFSQMAAVVHHGGAGTTGAALRAGIPSVVVPHFGDQPFWAHRVAALGVGPGPIPRSQLSAERLASAITAAVSDKAMHRRAAELGARIQAEDGVAKAVEAIDYYLLNS